MLQVSWSIGGRCLSKLFNDFFIHFHIFRLFISDFAVKGKAACSLQPNWRKPSISQDDLPMAGGGANHLDPMDFPGGGVVQTWSEHCGLRGGQVEILFTFPFFCRKYHLISISKFLWAGGWLGQVGTIWQGFLNGWPPGPLSPSLLLLSPFSSSVARRILTCESLELKCNTFDCFCPGIRGTVVIMFGRSAPAYSALCLAFGRQLALSTTSAGKGW